MDADSFGIVEAVKNGYRFVFREKYYLLKIAALPLLAHIATAFIMQAKMPAASILWFFISNLPANILFAWFLFLETRLLLLGERFDRLPQDPAYRKERHRSMQSCILVLLMFNLVFTAIAASLDWLARSELLGKNGLATGITLFLVGAMIWGVRLGLAHILAAVDYPIRRYIYRVDGVFFSFRLIGMAILTALPVFFVFQLVFALIVPDMQSVGETQIYVLIALSAPLSFLVTALLNAAGAFALRDLLSRPNPREKSA